MPVPDVQSLIFPTLKALEGGADTSTTEPRQRVAAAEGLTPGELRELPAKSPVPRFTNHVAWALVRLQREGLVAKVRKSVYKLTPQGARQMAEPRARIDP